jgi:large subunit ribosomal protein L10
MALNYQEKEAVVAEVAAELKEAQTVVLAEYLGVTVGSMTQLRKQAREQGVYLRVLKNTLAQIAVKGTPFEALASDMKGPLIYGISQDPVAAPKVLNDFAKTNDKIVLKTGVYNGQLLSEAEVKELASIPSKDELLSKLLYVMQAPVSGFARCLAALAEQKEGGAAQEA